MSEISSKSVDLDMFGHPIAPIRDRRGRKSYAKTKENQTLVTMLRAAGWSQERIAERMGCDEKTLRKYFSRELAEAGDILEAEALEVIYAKMRQGNVSAARTVRQIVQDGRTKTPFPDYPKHNPAAAQPVPAPDEKAPQEKIGKKAELTEKAQSPTGDWKFLGH